MQQKKKQMEQQVISIELWKVVLVIFTIIIMVLSIMIKNNSIEIFTNIVKQLSSSISSNDEHNLEITKVSSYDNTITLTGVSFIIYEIDGTGGEIIDYAKDTYGSYVGEQDANGDYIVTTDENGKYTAELEVGTYKAVEVEAPTGYEVAEDQEFEISCLQISDIEELIRFTENGKTYSNATVILTTDLDFNNVTSYKNSDNFGTLTYTPKAEFYGSFYGQGYKISNLTINQTVETPVGRQRSRYNCLCKWSNYRWSES